MLQLDMPPTPYAKRMRPVFIGMLVALFGLVIGKFVISDFWGAIEVIFAVLMGVLVLSGGDGINPANMFFFCVIATIVGVFDVISCILYFQHSKYKVFEKGAPTMVLLAQTTFIVSPILLFLSAMLAYSVFSDCQRQHTLAEEAAGGIFDGFGAAQAGFRGGTYEEQRPLRQQGPADGASRRPFVPFQGEGRHLGSGP